MRDSICESIIRLFVSDRGGYTIEPIYPSSDLESLFSRDVNELSSRFLYSPPPPSLLSALVAYLVSVFHLDSLLVNIDVFVSIRETRLDNLLFSWPRVGRIRTGQVQPIAEIIERFHLKRFVSLSRSIKIILSSVSQVKFIIRCIFFFFFLRMLLLLLR